MQNVAYGFQTTVSLGYDEAVTRVKEALKERGFGVLCEIDVAKTLKEKLGVEREPYVILGACNPHFAHRALSEEPDLGLLLPCNVVVRRHEGRTQVLAVDARAMLGVTGNDQLAPIADEVTALLRAALESVR